MGCIHSSCCANFRSVFSGVSTIVGKVLLKTQLRTLFMRNMFLILLAAYSKCDKIQILIPTLMFILIPILSTFRVSRNMTAFHPSTTIIVFFISMTVLIEKRRRWLEVGSTARFLYHLFQIFYNIISNVVFLFFNIFFPFSVSPMIWVPNQLVGAPVGTDVTIDCHTEAHPK